MADPIDLDELEAIVRSGSFTGKEIARQLKRRYADVRRVLRDDWQFTSTRDGRRVVWGITIAEETEQEEPEPEADPDGPGTVPEEEIVVPEDDSEEEPEVVYAIEDLDGVIALTLDEDGEQVLARIRVTPSGTLLADTIVDDGYGRVFDPIQIVDVVRAA